MKEKAASTRETLKSMFDAKVLFAAFDQNNVLDRQLDEAAKSAQLAIKPLSDFEEQVLSLARSANLVRSREKQLSKFAFVDLTDIELVKKASEFLQKFNYENSVFIKKLADIEKQKKEFGRSDSLDTLLDATLSNGSKRLDEARENFAKFLRELKTTIVVDGKDVQRSLFETESHLQAFIDKLFLLDQSTKKAAAAGGLKEVDAMLENLGITLKQFGKQTELQKLNQWLSDPAITAAIEERAKALHMTAEELKNIMRESAKLKTAGDAESGAAGASTTAQGHGAQVPDWLRGGLDRIDEATGKIKTFDDVMRQVGDTAADVFMQMGEGLGVMLENWVLLGDQADISFKKMLASTLAGVAAQSATLAVFHTAMGIAALTPWGAVVYGPAPLHFKAAALWAGIAAATALAGRGVAGDSFQSHGTSSNQNQPDYYASNPSTNNIQTNPQGRSLDRFDRRVGELASAVAGLENKLSSMKPEDVVVIGARRKGPLITDVVVTGIKSNGSKATEMGKALRLR